MKQQLLQIEDSRLLWPGVRSLTMEAPELATAFRPGQFALVRDPARLDPYLRRTAWLFRVDGARVTLAVPERDALGRVIRVGDRVDVLAPLGRALALEEGARRILLVGEAAGAAPLVALADSALRAAPAREIVFVFCAAPDGELLPAHLLPPEIEYRIDQAAKPLADAMNADLITWADVVFASGPEELYRVIAERSRALRYRLAPGFLHVWVNASMPCGRSACYACAVETPRGLMLACRDGPAFDWSELPAWRTR